MTLVPSLEPSLPRPRKEFWLSGSEGLLLELHPASASEGIKVPEGFTLRLQVDPVGGAVPVEIGIQVQIGPCPSDALFPKPNG